MSCLVTLPKEQGTQALSIYLVTLVLLLNQKPLFNLQFHKILPINAKKATFDCQVLHIKLISKPNPLINITELVFSKSPCHISSTAEAKTSISFEILSFVWFGRGREIHDHFWQIRATTVINPCNKLWQIHEKTLTNLILTLNFKVLVTMIGFGSDKKCWSVFVDLYLYIFMYIYICMFINKFISWYKLRNISGSASNLCCIIDALLRFCNDDWCILSQIENVVVWIQNISHLTTMCTYIWISKEGCP